MASTGQQQPQQQQQRPGGGPNNAGNGAKGRPNRWTGSHNFGNASNNQQGCQAGNHQGNGSRTASPANNAAARGPSATSNTAAPAGLTALSNEDNARLHDRMLYLLVNMIGTKVRVTVKSGPTWSGILSSTSDTELSVHLKAARQLLNDIPQNPPKSLLIQAKDIVQIQADKVDFDTKPGGPSTSSQSRPVSPQSAAEINSIGALLDAAAASRDKFRTDTDISGSGAGKERRELQKWGSGNALLGGSIEGAGDGGIGGSSLEDDDGLLEAPSRGFANNGQNSSSSTGKWDQFATNEKLFGAKTNYQEELYTTKLDKSGADFKAKEARAIKLANEILTGVSSNAHIAEERGQIVNDDSGMDEEDKYSGVLRGPNAYVPPGARRTMAAAVAGGPAATNNAAKASQPAAPATEGTAAQQPSSSDNKMNGSASAKVEQPVQAEGSNKAVPDVSVTPTTATEQPAAQPQTSDKVVEDFRKFVGTEKEKMIQKKQQLVQKQKEDRIADLRAFSKTFMLKSAVPADLVPLLAKDEAKQKELASRKVSAATAAPSSQSSTTSTIKPSASTVASPNLGAAVVPVKNPTIANVASASGTPAKKASPYALAAIPAFDPVKAAAARAAKAGIASPQPAAASTSAAASSTGTTKFNAAAPAFVFRPGAASFQPGAAAASPAPAPIAEASATAAPPTIAVPGIAPTVTPQPSVPANPFFGTAPHRASPRDKLLHVKEDFSPFKRTTSVPAPETVTQEWGYTGKSFRSIGSPTGAVTSSASVSNVSSPMPAHANIPTPAIMQSISPHPGTAIPAQFYQQQQHPLPHHPHAQQHHQSNLSNASAASGRNLNVRSPPPTNHMSRSPSNAGTLPSSISANTLSTGTDDGTSQRSSTVPTPVPSSSASQAGAPVHTINHPNQQGQQTHMLPQSYAMYQNQQYQAGLQAGTPYRFAPGANMPQPQQGGIQHGQIQQQQHPGQPNQQIHHFAVPHGSHIPYPPQQGYVTQVPFSPQAMHATQPMFSPQLANQMPAGQMYHPSMFVQQGGARGQQNAPQMPGVPHQQYYYQHVPQQGGMPGQYMAVPSQGMQMPTPQMQSQAQPAYEQGA